MSKIRSYVASFIRDERGVTAIEYGLIAAAIAAAISATVWNLGNSIGNKFNNIINDVK